MVKKKKLLVAFICFILILFLGCGLFILKKYVFGSNTGSYYNDDGSYRHITGTSSFQYVEKHPAFVQFSSFIQPWKDKPRVYLMSNLSIDWVSKDNHVDAASVVDGFNFIIDEAEKQNIYYDFYTQEEIAEDSSKDETGLLFIPGEKDAPVAIISAGGAFKSVCMFLEAFPVAQELHEMGYNVFMLKYRVNPDGGMEKADMDRQEKYANEDYGRAMQYIFQNQEKLGVQMENYSVWGFSAGGRLTQLWGLENDFGYDHYEIPKPTAMMLVYSGWYDEHFKGQYATQPATYFAYLDNDDVIGAENVSAIERYIEELRSLNIPTDVHVYHEAKHGFGAGIGTDAEGWVTDAVAFWEEQ